MNMAVSGVAGSRPARGFTDNRWRPQKHDQGAQNSVSAAAYGSGEPIQDSASTSASLRSPGTITTGIGNEPTVLAIMVTRGPGPSAPGLAASTSMAISTS